ncbi:hypothetical protein SNOG_06432 [Parastagonospora nodorum SN15]|uniref:Uncharacterized protein n=1 Tax=Phaeosphaeria nodorum (strain SN15 / ATCC MYA-4574 / FGSC 10173) TaxID=321614 RepID=Q0UP82_PHANO|nr:hypothetical protein SNOG_06432 [Parastagonospora nodorum SN15]EAT86263.2 hypothetical protein SNOG_06432 [Parastagonospora nodorum SN15]
MWNSIIVSATTHAAKLLPADALATMLACQSTCRSSAPASLRLRAARRRSHSEQTQSASVFHLLHHADSARAWP